MGANITEPKPTQSILSGKVFNFTFDRAKCPISRNFVLNDDGTIGGHSHKDEAFWTVDGGRLVVLNEARQPSCIYDEVIVTEHETLNLSGKFLLVPDGQIYNLDEHVSAAQRLRTLPKTLRFEGEFGEEVNHFVPYIHWLFRNRQMQGRQVETYAGMEPFYFFLDAGMLITRSAKRAYLSAHLAPAHYLHPSGLTATRSGMEWSPDYRTQYATNFGLPKPLLAIHNKYTSDWAAGPANFLSLETLDQLFVRLRDQFQIVFFEAEPPADEARGYSMDHQPPLPFDDAQLARKHPGVIVFGDLLKTTPDSYNLLKLKIFASCYFFITVQGGNAHLCAQFPGALVAIQHTVGIEDSHTYKTGVFQFLANPRPLFLIGRNGRALLECVDSFTDCSLAGDRVHLGPKGLAAYQRYNPQNWTSEPVF